MTAAGRARSVACRGLPPGLRDEDLLQGLELLDALAGAHRHGEQWLLGHVHGHPGLVPDPLVEPTQHTASTASVGLKMPELPQLSCIHCSKSRSVSIVITLTII